jgi:hypothetical protein
MSLYLSSEAGVIRHLTNYLDKPTVKGERDCPATLSDSELSQLSEVDSLLSGSYDIFRAKLFQRLLN